MPLPLWRVEAYLTGLKLPEGKMVIDGFTINKEDKHYILSTEVEAEDNQKAEIEAEEKFKSFIMALSLGAKTSYNYSICRATCVKWYGTKPLSSLSLDMSCSILEELKESDAKNILSIIRALESGDKYTCQAIKYFLMGLKLGSLWKSESFLNFYKAIELLWGKDARYLKKEFKEHIQAFMDSHISAGEISLNAKETEDFVNQIVRGKILMFYICNKLGYASEEIEKSGRLVEIRNDAAHPSGDPDEVTEAELNFCRDIAQKLILQRLRVE